MPCCCYPPEIVDTHLTTNWLPVPLLTPHFSDQGVLPFSSPLSSLIFFFFFFWSLATVTDVERSNQRSRKKETKVLTWALQKMKPTHHGLRDFKTICNRTSPSTQTTLLVEFQDDFCLKAPEKDSHHPWLSLETVTFKDCLHSDVCKKHKLGNWGVKKERTWVDRYASLGSCSLLWFPVGPHTPRGDSRLENHFWGNPLTQAWGIIFGRTQRCCFGPIQKKLWRDNNRPST